MTKAEREEREYKSLFTDERYAKKAWRAFFGRALESDAAVLPEILGANGEVSPQSIIYNTAYQNVRTRLEADGLTRKPMKAEILVEASIIRAAFDNSTLNTVLDRTAGKVKEEITIGTGQYEEMSDEELEVIALHRAGKLTADKVKTLETVDTE